MTLHFLSLKCRNLAFYIEGWVYVNHDFALFRFSSKSDVWAFGVLCWEVFTCGEMPYGRAKNPEVVERVQRGQILSRPQQCPHQVYEVIILQKFYNVPEI